jgi:hypothetical protein
MTIKRLPTTANDFPGADIYLDDLAEIVGILKSEGGDATVEITIGDERCDSLDDLPKIGERIGGRSKNLVLVLRATGDYLYIKSFGSRLDAGGSAQRRAWVIAQVREVFNRRRVKWVSRFPWTFTIASVLLIVALSVFAAWLRRHSMPLAGYGFYSLEWVLGGSFGWYFGSLYRRAEDSLVILDKYTMKKGFFSVHKDQILLAAICTVIGTVIGSLIPLVFRTIFHQP